MEIQIGNFKEKIEGDIDSIQLCKNKGRVDIRLYINQGNKTTHFNLNKMFDRQGCVKESCTAETVTGFLM